MAAALLKARLPDVEIVSAGLGALVGRPAEVTAFSILKHRGIDMSDHRAQQLTELLCKQAELILVMEQAHKDQVERLYPFTRGRVYRLGSHGDYDVFDPYRQGEERFEACYALIKSAADKWAVDVMQLA